MTETQLEQVIREYFLDICKKEYIGKITIQKLDPVGYNVRLGLDVIERPLVLYAELNDEDFLKFIKQEIKNFKHRYYGKLNLINPYDCKPRNTSCDCK